MTFISQFQFCCRIEDDRMMSVTMNITLSKKEKFYFEKFKKKIEDEGSRDSFNRKLLPSSVIKLYPFLNYKIQPLFCNYARYYLPTIELRFAC